ncbi:SpoIIE family protein phosphatase [Streptomyces sp. HK10]|uniref:SpoIIE family protein phosphatase n=1 Tax=Streptomyces sp. HK10 TaxID=3373255 RepID=UPI0037490127
MADMADTTVGEPRPAERGRSTGKAGERELRQLLAGLTAVRDGDFGTRLPDGAEGVLGEIATVFNGMVDQLSLFTSEVTRVSREVGSEGRLGGQAEVEGVSGTWKRLTENVNELAGSLTRQVRAIAEVTGAVAEGDLTRSITVDASGEVADLEGNVNFMVQSLRETTRANQEQDWLKTNLARISGLMQGHRDLAVVAELIMDELTPLVGAQYGAFYLAEDDDGGTELRLVGSYGHPAVAEGAEPPRFGLGQSLAGQAARSRRTITVDDLPAGYVTVSSGPGATEPTGLIVLPITAEDQVLGVIELASVTPFTALHQDFLGRRQAPEGCRVTVPADNGGRILGVLEICWPGPLEPQSPQVQRQIEALAELCAHTLDSRAADTADSGDVLQARHPGASELVDFADGLLDPALVLVPQPDAEGRLADFRIHHVSAHFVDPVGRPRGAVAGSLLLEAYPMAVGESGLFEKIEHVHATGEPFRAERMVLRALVGQVPLTVEAAVSISRHGENVLLIRRVQDEAARLASVLRHAQRLGRIGGFEENLVTGEIVWNSRLFALHGLPPTAAPIPLEQLPAHTHADDEAAIGRFLRTLLHHRRPASTAFRLQRTDGIVRHIRVVAEPALDDGGRLVAVRGAYQDVSAQHWTEVALGATRDQLAHTEQQAAERNRMTPQLQRAIMPPTRGPIDAGGLDIAVRYRPAEKDHLVGGDWYDAVVLPSGQVLLSVGDVAGHGIEAATGMVVLRNALRGLATTGAGPAQILAWLNTVAHHLTENVTATAVCGLYDPDTRTLRWARAGHPPPVLVRRGEAATLPLVGGLLLGAVAEAGYEEEKLVLETGDMLLMYTDGLIERRDRSLQESADQLMALARDFGATLDKQLDRLLTYSNSDTDDDTCVVGVLMR